MKRFFSFFSGTRFSILAVLMITTWTAWPAANCFAQRPLMIVEAGTGAVTPPEIAAFKQFLQSVPLPKDNLHNEMVYGGSGMAVEALGRVYEISGDSELLDTMVELCDAMLAARNDAKTGVLIWTGERDPVWPNSVAAAGAPSSAGTENGDIVGHIAYTARLILQNKALADTKIPGGDPHGFGETYHARALTYIHAMDATTDAFLLKWFVKPDTLRLYTPNSPVYESVTRPGAADKPVPWNQQAMLCNGFQRLAEAHALLGDAPERVKQYEAIVKAALDWFFAEVEHCDVNGKPCYKWAYPPGEKPIHHYEDTAHGGYDIAFFYRAYESGRYGLTRVIIDAILH